MSLEIVASARFRKDLKKAVRRGFSEGDAVFGGIVVVLLKLPHEVGLDHVGGRAF